MEAPGEQPARTSRVAAWRRRISKGRGRWLGIAVALACTAAILLPDPGVLPGVRFWAFDTYQFFMPRERTLEPAVIVAIDDKSLRAKGQWPWPRDLVAELIDRIAARGPISIGLDILFTEPDRASPDEIAAAMRARNPALARELAKLKPNDDVLAESLKRAHAVIGIAGIDAPTARRTGESPALIIGTPPPLHDYPGVLRSIPMLDRAAAGHGLLNSDSERGVVRSMPLAASVAGEPALTLVLECLRVSSGFDAFHVDWDRSGTLSVQFDRGFSQKTQRDGRVWLHYSRRTPSIYLSASDVLDGTDDPARLKDAIALVGVTATGLLDQSTSARGERMPGIEFHAQLAENIAEKAFVFRPRWARYAEAGVFALIAALLVVSVPRTRPRWSLILLLTCWLVLSATGIAAFARERILVDPTAPLIAITLLYGLMLSATLVATDVERRDLSVRLAREREAAARVTGELEAGRRIQLDMLPTRESVVRGERRVELFAHMSAAREVGGDLYDFFPVSADCFVVIVGDVSGKGLPAAMFMAVTKALAKSCALRGQAAPAVLMSNLNTELSRENTEQMFVTLVLLVLDLATGQLEYCNAGHEPPLLVRRGGETIALDRGGGPPLCVLDDFPYEQAGIQLEPRDLLALASDGITEAMNRAGALYGRARLRALLETAARREPDVTVLGNEILASIGSFVGDAEPSDDQTLLLVSWRGPA